jgi:hypothetical protein
MDIADSAPVSSVPRLSETPFLTLDYLALDLGEAARDARWFPAERDEKLPLSKLEPALAEGLGY